ncbi:helix-turn-helix domain-containing protein [Alicyclobacillus acidocaldarius]|uniref:Helix-turn-helix domain protein n=1 Tax=Alicyclobacillus acidocaldarius subsp. acidocaldarius (strain ATCC 27009 / DSM 446 / BCRC 14685 / JCM 5260 / KCTC 1825 / NBRC 15652 / NCIMB 11725 / NRRL B-14509 / 104-IA) TaxID=521098 RepID=C8WT61_ALIAD|nr:helix-turn-helix transcriptional regulator [Alicyclobacillus acidocaldarius]ACV59575.1 helix-turn-helix domain protein [Alicyclobacillus acidocaldarius subsp. acidocaldarius DSM 446]
MDVSIGETIRTLRTARGLSLAELADDLASPDLLDEIESGRALAPYPLLIRVADRLGEPIDRLLADVDPHALLQAAIRVAQYDVAAGHPHRARDILTHLPEASFHTRSLSEYRLTLARALRGLGEEEEAVALLIPLAEAAQSADDARLAFYALRELGFAECDRGNVPGAVRLWKDALARVDALAATYAVPSHELHALAVELYLHLDDLDPHAEGFDVPWRRSSFDPQPRLRAEFAPADAAAPVSKPPSAPKDRPYLAAAERMAASAPALFVVAEELIADALRHLAVDPAQARALAEQASTLLFVGRLAEIEASLHVRLLGAAPGAARLSTRLERAYLMTAVSPGRDLAAFADEIARQLDDGEIDRAATLLESAQAIAAELPDLEDLTARRARLKLTLLDMEAAYAKRPRERASLRKRLIAYEQSFPEWGEAALHRRACQLLIRWLAEARDFESALRYVQKLDALSREPRPPVPFVF